MKDYTLDELLALGQAKRVEVIARLTTKQKKHIYDSVTTLTKLRQLDNLAGHEERVRVRDGFIQNYPDDIHWDYAEYVNRKSQRFSTTIKISTNGDVVLYRPLTGYLSVISNDDDEILNYKTVCYKEKNIMVSRAVTCTFLPVPDHLKKYPVGSLRSRHVNDKMRDNRLDNLLWDAPANNTRGSVF